MRHAIIGALFAVFVILSAVAGCGGEEEPPPREQYPLLQQRVYELQVAVAERNRAAIDSMMAVEALDYDVSSDSLLRYVYGPGADFAFEAFGDCKIAYTEETAQIDCFIQDSTRGYDRPVRFIYTLKEDSLWLLERFRDAPEDTEQPIQPDTTADGQ
ncbi:hypothetical protein GF420_16365 [candidate division GN15 bacterium]|nr:hypothetical protein [candidate division GN15 bacterium]